ncbi:hypothetical protein [Bradyrhizobium sp. AZCC 1578]|uniref:hypothetical protein n=1 Tax=Bradyrhizobium sp. AZCC 1578 TaxID=3117027 RepID=UPI002FEF7871
MMMRSFALIEGDRATMLHVRHDGDVMVFDRDRESAIRFRVPMDIEGDTTWRLLHRVLTGLVQAEAHLIRIDRLVERSEDWVAAHPGRDRSGDPAAHPAQGALRHRCHALS